MRALSEGARQIDLARMHDVYSSTIGRWAEEIGVTRGCRFTEEELERRFAKWDDAEAAERQEMVKQGRTPPPVHKTFKAAESFDTAITDFINRASEEISRDNSIEGQIKVQVGSMLLEQLYALKGNLPPVNSWAEVEKVVKLLRQNFNMDTREGEGKMVDLGLLTGKSRVVEAEIVPKKVPKRIVSQSTNAEEEEEFEI